MDYAVRQGPIEINNNLMFFRTFTAEEISMVQQIYDISNRYIKGACQTGDKIIADVIFDSILGIRKRLNYAPASTISAFISQCCAVALWSTLQKKYENPVFIFNQLVEKELIGLKKEEYKYHMRVPLKQVLTATITINQIKEFQNNIVADLKIDLGPYLECHVIGFCLFNNL